MGAVRFGLALIGVALLAAAAQAQSPLALGTASVGGTYYVYGETVARVLNEKTRLKVVTQQTQGPNQNIVMVDERKLELGMVTMGVALQGMQGSAAWTRGRKYEGIRALFPMYDTPMQCLALKKSGASDASIRTRLSEAEAMILDRVCEGGGWNYGNAAVLGQDLRPYVPTTALAVMAMQDRREHPAITSSISWLRAHAVTEQATMALSLATLGLQLARESPEIPRAELLRHAQSTRDFGNAHLMAMALYALTSDEHGALAFKLS